MLEIDDVKTRVSSSVWESCALEQIQSDWLKVHFQWEFIHSFVGSLLKHSRNGHHNRWESVPNGIHCPVAHIDGLLIPFLFVSFGFFRFFASHFIFCVHLNTHIELSVWCFRVPSMYTCHYSDIGFFSLRSISMWSFIFANGTQRNLGRSNDIPSMDKYSVNTEIIINRVRKHENAIFELKVCL